ncbi:Gfo/Idh/MocA family oxidoreductase [Natronorubrum sp. FCH18a]|uniref:Gfo/Idh/MocA family oxidoreductase n=1 Tax=Natronorubrum sp. FCH18a TaxID=3447018 RepID=UPI003F510833
MLDTTVETRENDTHADEQAAFFDAIENGGDAGSSVEEALTVQRIVDGIYRSSEDGRSVALDDT